MIVLLDAHSNPIPEKDTLIQDACTRAGIYVGQWSLDDLAKLDGEAILASHDVQSQALEAVKTPLAQLKRRFGYQYEDIVGLTPQHSQLRRYFTSFSSRTSPYR